MNQLTKVVRKLFYVHWLFWVISSSLLVTNTANAQQNDFCDGVLAIMHDAPNRFRNIRGKELQQNATAIIWESGINITGTTASRFVFSNGIFYEGALLQTRDSSELRGTYNRYENLLDSCLLHRGFSRLLTKNKDVLLATFDKIAYLPEELTTATHAALEVTYMKNNGLYTLELFIYCH
jgi:hypothetical protein